MICSNKAISWQRTTFSSEPPTKKRYMEPLKAPEKRALAKFPLSEVTKIYPPKAEATPIGQPSSPISNPMAPP